MSAKAQHAKGTTMSKDHKPWPKKKNIKYIVSSVTATVPAGFEFGSKWAALECNGH